MMTVTILKCPEACAACLSKKKEHKTHSGAFVSNELHTEESAIDQVNSNNNNNNNEEL